MVVPLAIEYFGCHDKGRAADGIGEFPVVEFAGEAEVGDLDLEAAAHEVDAFEELGLPLLPVGLGPADQVVRCVRQVDEDVGQLEVPVHHLLLVDLFEARHQLLKDHSCLKFGEAAASDFLEVVEVAGVAEVHEEVEVVLGPLDVVQPDYVRTLYFRQNVDLVLQIVEQPRRQTRFLYHLHREMGLLVRFQGT